MPTLPTSQSSPFGSASTAPSGKEDLFSECHSIWYFFLKRLCYWKQDAEQTPSLCSEHKSSPRFTAAEKNMQWARKQSSSNISWPFCSTDSWSASSWDSAI